MDGSQATDQTSLYHRLLQNSQQMLSISNQSDVDKAGTLDVYNLKLVENVHSISNKSHIMAASNSMGGGGSHM